MSLWNYRHFAYCYSLQAYSEPQALKSKTHETPHALASSLRHV